MLGQIRLFVLLESLGRANMTVPSYLQTTQWAHTKMASIENRLRALQLLKTSPFNVGLLDKRAQSVGFQDPESDHTPFADRGVPFVHLAAQPTTNIDKDDVLGRT